MTLSKNSRVIAARLSLHGVKRFAKIEAAMPMIGAIVQGEIRTLTPFITGTLRRGVSFRFYKQGPFSILLETYGTAYYTVFVEFGTHKMAPRRMFSKGSANAQVKIESYVRMI